MPDAKSILFLTPVAFVQRQDEPGFQVQTLNFRTAFSFVMPQLITKGIDVTLVSLNNNVRQLGYAKEYLRHTGLETSCRACFFERKAGRGRLLPQVKQFLLNVRHLYGVLQSVNPDIVYGYNDVGTLYGVILKLFFRFRLVYDMRGDRVNEMAVQGAPRWRVSLYRFIRNRCLRKSDLVFTVSDNCKDLPPGQRHVSKYNFYNADRFFYDPEKASEVKEELGVANRFVIVYSGTEKYYQMVPQMVDFFAEFLKVCPDAWMMVNLPGEARQFPSLLKQRGISENSYGLFKLDQSELGRYQMVADLALLIREDLPLNNEAFPTKFPEYLACGVPVLISPYVFTLERMVRENNLGVIWKENENPEQLFDRILLYRDNQQMKMHCANFAREHLSWQHKATWLADVILS